MITREATRDHLVDDLRSMGFRVEPVPGMHSAFAVQRHDDPAAVAALLIMDADAVSRRLSALEPDAAEVFPDVPPARAAYQLLLVHLDEQLRVSGPRLRLLGIEADGLVLQRGHEGPEQG